MFPEDRLRIAAARFARAVRPGGLIIIEPWIDPAIYIPDSRRMHTYDGENLKLCRIGISNRETREGVDLAVLDFYWLALEAGVAVAEHFTERHVVWLCTRAQLIAAFADAGFEARLEPNGLMRDRGLIIGRRTS